MAFVRPSLVLLLILTALPAGAQTLQSGWISDPRTGCKAWSRFNGGDPRHSISWSGPCVNGLADGKGEMRYLFEGKVGDARYEGEMRQGKRHGRGVSWNSSGGRYEGEFRDGKHSGHGVWTTPDGDVFDGNWVNDRPHGQGTYLDKDKGVTYSGIWTDGCFQQGEVRLAIGRTRKRCGFPPR